MRLVDTDFAPELSEAERAELTPILHGALPDGAEIAVERILRRVARVRLASGRVVYAKQHLLPFLRVRLRYALRASPATREYDKLERALARGLQVPRPLALHVERGLLGPRLAVLVTEALPDGRPLRLDELEPAIDRLAEAGVFHPDLHAENVRRIEGAPAFLDFQSVRFQTVTRRDRIEMFAKFVSSSAPDVQRGVEEHVFRSARDRAEIERSLASLAGRADASARRHRLRSSSKVVRERLGLLGARIRKRELDPARLEDAEFGVGERIRGDARFGDHERAVSRDGEIVRLRGREAYRELWARASENEAFLAWTRNAPWPWATQALYIQAHPRIEPT